MDGSVWASAALVLLFILIGGVFAGTEIALLSLRESQVARLERRGRRGARVAAVARDPNRFLAAVQIGVTVAGFFSAAYGASTLADDVAPALAGLGLPEAAADTVALIVLTLVIAYLSLVLGELVPKRLAMQRSAAMALAVGPPLDRFAGAMRPVIWLLSRSTNAVVRLLGGNPAATGEEITEEELRDLVAGHQSLTADERRILADVLGAGDRIVGEVMRPRPDVTFLRGSLTVAQARSVVTAGPYSRYPVTGEGFDDVLGFLHVRDLLEADPDRPVAGIVRPIVELPATSRLLPSLSLLRREGTHMALVVDEYGGTDGIVTLEDLVEELVGEIHDEYDEDVPELRPSPDGRVVAEATLTIEDFAERTGVTLPDGPYETAAGFVLQRLGRLARVGDAVDVPGGAVTLVVTQVTARRIVALEVVPVPGATDGAAGDDAGTADAGGAATG